MALVLTTALLVAACGGDDGPTNVDVSLAEWSVTPSTETTTEGAIRFTLLNTGTAPHQFVVVKSDLPPEQLPVADGKVVESQVNIVDKVEAFAPASSQTLTLDLTPGKYLLICNLTERPPGGRPISHYQEGMVAFFLVEPD
jgi:uncharacterized cupredoxin-like copper-binding protein